MSGYGHGPFGHGLFGTGPGSIRAACSSVINTALGRSAIGTSRGRSTLATAMSRSTFDACLPVGAPAGGGGESYGFGDGPFGDTPFGGI